MLAHISTTDSEALQGSWFSTAASMGLTCYVLKELMVSLAFKPFDLDYTWIYPRLVTTYTVMVDFKHLIVTNVRFKHTLDNPRSCHVDWFARCKCTGTPLANIFILLYLPLPASKQMNIKGASIFRCGSQIHTFSVWERDEMWFLSVKRSCLFLCVCLFFCF